ncbi:MULTISPECIES: hypothetical protein [Anaeromyxobacter]|uniref:hypothetical protein n=1 Tax=Anaeromyxobacter TaxID=161492 RepID=UPI001F573C49|nr:MULTISPECIES: hypothetical protein [unclassified Anaeromyxobacter]
MELTLHKASRALGLLAALALPGLGYAAHPFPITLKDAAGTPVATSARPYSSEKSCGGCHDFGAITQGYHFQQGRTNAAGDLQVSDTFAGDIGAGQTYGIGTGAWWKLSDGMYGKW